MNLQTQVKLGMATCACYPTTVEMATHTERLYAASVIFGQLWSENIKCNTPEIMNNVLGNLYYTITNIVLYCY